jgi:hypothetical protein
MRFSVSLQRTLWRPLILTVILSALVLASAACSRPGYQQPEKGNANAEPIKNGVYAVLGEAPSPEQAPVDGGNSVVLAYDKRYTDAGPDGSVRYVTIDTSSFVPLILEGAPDATKDDGGKTILSITLQKEYAKKLEDFTREHRDGKVAILIGGEIVTLHTIRSVISGGQFQITRCADNACEVLRAKLTK